MQYVLLIYENEALLKDMTPEQGQAEMQEYTAFTVGIQQSGHMKGGAPLEPTRAATSVRVKNGKTIATDGPFAETREQLGGYYVVDAKDLDEAIAIAARIPAARKGCIEIRPVMNVGMESMGR